MKVMIVDDHPLVRQGLAAVLSLDPSIVLVAEAGCKDEALKYLKDLKTDIALIDIRLKDGDGFEIITEAKNRNINCKFIILTSSVDHDDFERAVEMEADGYIIKEAFPEEVLTALRVVYQGRKYYDPYMMELALVKDRDMGLIEKLTPREKEVLSAIGRGMSNHDIAKTLFITEYTVKKHVSRILDKLNLKDRTQAAIYAHKRRMI